LEFSGSLLSTVRSLYFQVTGKAGREVFEGNPRQKVFKGGESAISVSIVDTLVGVILISVVHRPAPAASGAGFFFAQSSRPHKKSPQDWPRGYGYMGFRRYTTFFVAAAAI
jgi:hypothetical protein